MKPNVRNLLAVLFLSSSLALAFAPGDKERLETTRQCPDCDLSDIAYGQRDFSTANLQGSDISDSAFFRTNFQNANLRDTDLRGSVFFLVDFTGADLSGARTNGALFFLCFGR